MVESKLTATPVAAYSVDCLVGVIPSFISLEYQEPPCIPSSTALPPPSPGVRLISPAGSHPSVQTYTAWSSAQKALGCSCSWPLRSYSGSPYRPGKRGYGEALPG